jgi:hypothetical protein
MKKQIVNIGENQYKLIFDEFDNDFEIDDLLKIDYSNLIGEIITFPVIVNRFGILLAECERVVSEAKMNLDVMEAKLKEKLKLRLAEENGGKNPTVDALNSALILEKSYQAMRKKYIECQKTRDYINSVFWSAKDKSEKLNKLSMTIQQGDVDEQLLEGSINSVLIKKTDKLIK